MNFGSPRLDRVEGATHRPAGSPAPIYASLTQPHPARRSDLHPSLPSINAQRPLILSWSHHSSHRRSPLHP